MKPGLDYVGISVSFLCHDGQGNILLQKRSMMTRDEQGRWESGGGQLQFGETLEDGALREIKEEYGCVGVIELALPPLPIFRVLDGQPTHWINHFYIVRVNRTDVQRNEVEAMEELGWFTVGNLPEPLHVGMAFRLKEHGEIIRKHFDGLSKSR